MRQMWYWPTRRSKGSDKALHLNTFSNVEDPDSLNQPDHAFLKNSGLDPDSGFEELKKMK